MSESPTAPGAPEMDQLPTVDPDSVPISRGDHTDPDREDYRSEVFQLMSPRARAAIIDVLLQAGDEAITASEMVDRHSGVTSSSFSRHKDDLLNDFGIMVEAGKQGNAQTYRLNTNHPAVQLLGMINQVYSHGTTPPLLDKEFYRDDSP